MKPLSWLLVGLSLFVLAGCVYPLTLRSRDGATLNGNYHFAHQHTGYIRLLSPDGEILSGQFAGIGRRDFVARYEKTFGRGTVSLETPDVSAYGNAFGSRFASSHALIESAHGEIFRDSGAFPVAVSGPLFYWTATLKGDRGAMLTCYFIGSQYTGGGFGRCKDDNSKEYTAEF